jgi:hypothetical protein
MNMAKKVIRLGSGKIKGSKYKFAQADVIVPDSDSDINIVLPDGEKIVLQIRTEGDFPSLDICFEKDRLVRNWARDMEPAPAVKSGKQKDFRCFQLWVGLDPKAPAF